MKTEPDDSFWKWFTILFVVGVFICLLLAVVLIQFRPRVFIEATAAEPTSTTTESLWDTQGYYPPFYPW